MQKFSNNASTTVAVPLTDSAMTLAVAASTGFATLESGKYELVTLTDGQDVEIVKVTARSGTSWTVTRAQEGTTARAWPAGTQIQARLTAGTLAGLTQTALTPDLVALDHGGNARGTEAVNLQSGRTNAENVASGAYAVAWGYDSKASGYGSLAAGTKAVASGQDAVAIGRDAQATGTYAVALGYNAQATDSCAVALGFNARASNWGTALGGGSRALGGVALGGGSALGGRLAGPNGLAYALESVSLCGVPVTSRHAIVAQGFFAVPRDDWNDEYERSSAGAVAVMCSPYVDLGAPAAWQAATRYDQGDVVQPTAGGSVQYRVWAGFDSEDGVRYSANSTATEPTWPGAGDYVELDADSYLYWIGTDWSAGYLTEGIPDGLAFFPTELAFICHEHSTMTGTPNISIGTAATPGLLVDADDVTITGAHQIFRFTLANPTPAIPSGTAIQIKVNTAASAGRCVGRFLLSGYFVENPTNAV